MNLSGITKKFIGYFINKGKVADFSVGVQNKTPEVYMNLGD